MSNAVAMAACMHALPPPHAHPMYYSAMLGLTLATTQVCQELDPITIPVCEQTFKALGMMQHGPHGMSGELENLVREGQGYKLRIFLIHQQQGLWKDYRSTGIMIYV